jgi:hypothetical protein
MKWVTEFNLNGRMVSPVQKDIGESDGIGNKAVAGWRRLKSLKQTSSVSEMNNKPLFVNENILPVTVEVLLVDEGACLAEENPAL